MKAVILAGGLGTRLSEETHLKPKPMVEIGGRPILWHILKTANVAKADALLDWRPVTSPEEGFKFTAEWHARESEWLDGIQL